MRKIIIFLLLFSKMLFGCAMCGNASFVYTTADIRITKESIQKISVTWMFDETVSTQLINGYDKNKNHKFDPEETKDMLYVIAEQKPSFLTSVSIDGKDKKIQSLQNFKAYIKNKNVYYSFDIILNTPLKEKNDIELFFVDPSHTLAFIYQDKGVQIENDGSHKIKQEFGFKVLQDIMAVVNELKVEIKK